MPPKSASAAPPPPNNGTLGFSAAAAHDKWIHRKLILTGEDLGQNGILRDRQYLFVVLSGQSSGPEIAEVSIKYCRQYVVDDKLTPELNPDLLVETWSLSR